jgi:hypothetical protein
MIFFLMVLVILVFVVLWNYDLHKILYVKSIAQNGGDSAALVAARWQGITLNLIGDLNIIHALAIKSDGTDADVAASISNIQARLCYVGPMIAFMAAQQAAKNNHVFQNDAYSQYTLHHADEVRYNYPSATTPSGIPLFPEPYPGCWNEYADMMELIGHDGVAAGADNAHFYSDCTGDHILLQVEFYDAIAGKDWCWWYHNAPTLLQDYVNFFPCWWPPLPDIPHIQYINSEIFGLGLDKIVTSLSAFADPPSSLSSLIEDLATERQLGAPPLSTNFVETKATWFCYNSAFWSPWNAMDTSGDDPFPATGSIKPQYDYAGADAAIRIEATASRLTPGPRGAGVSNTITWTAAAKPFGYLNDTDCPNSFGIVLPAFHEVALIPVDASSAPSGGSYNLPWREHIEQHLPLYMMNGPGASSCWYCQQLLTWEDPAFRQEGVVWLSSNSYQCVASGGGGGGGHHGGGTHRGH